MYMHSRTPKHAHPHIQGRPTFMQDRLCGRLVELYTESDSRGGPELRPLLRLALSSVGRGGKGDVGQRIRDDILGVQSRNGAKVLLFVGKGDHH